MSADLTLYDAALAVREALDSLDPETGELAPEFGDLHALIERKGVAVIAWLLEAEAQADYIDAEAQRLREKAVARRKKADRLRHYLADAMRTAGIDRITHERGLFEARLYRARDVAIEIDEGAKFPPELCNPPPLPQVSRTKLRYAIESGQPIQGAKLVRRDRLVIK